MLKKRELASVAGALAAAAIAVYLGTAHRLYDIPGLEGHIVRTVVLRKIASVVVFAALAVVLDVVAARLKRELRVIDGALLVGAVSALIEIVQDLRGSTEGLLWNLGDVILGAAGGAIGVMLAARSRARRLRGRR
jgi:hypothetical protein